MKHQSIPTIPVDKILANFEWFGLNIIWGAWTWAMLTQTVTWVLGALGGITLVWFNIERALKARKERKLLTPNSKRNGRKNQQSIQSSDE